MKNKYIKDYLHFYIGCEVVSVYPTNPQSPQILNGKFYDQIMNCKYEHFVYHSKWIKPLLRPLSSINDEEIDEVWYGEETQNVLVMEYKRNSNTRKVALCSERTRYLLSKGFDLFGLIDSSLALDKTKM